MRATALPRALPPLTLALVLGLCACTPVRWHKPSGDDSALTVDLAACHKLSQDRFGSASALGMTHADPRFGAPFGPSQAEARMQEGQALGACMRGKGYVLVEDKK